MIINVCTPNPCFNGGVCVANPNVQSGLYQCNCQNGYVGPRCEYCKC